jgi:hypothetical protein
LEDSTRNILKRLLSLPETQQVVLNDLIWSATVEESHHSDWLKALQTALSGNPAKKPQAEEAARYDFDESVRALLQVEVEYLPHISAAADMLAGKDGSHWGARLKRFLKEVPARSLANPIDEHGHN